MEMWLDWDKVALSLGLLFAVLAVIGQVVLAITGGSILNLHMQAHSIAINVVGYPGATATLQYTGFSAYYFVVGIILHFIVGAVIGGLFAWIWNWVNKAKPAGKRR